MDIENLRKEHENLITEMGNLKGINCTPIPDGIVDIDRYFKSDIKILWINKEVNSAGDNHAWSLIDVLNNLKSKLKDETGWGNTFTPIIYTLYGIFNQTNWENTPDIVEEYEIAEIIKNIAYINAKKLPGGAKANYNEVRKYSSENDILKRQITLFKPDVIICGGTFDILDNIFEEIYGEAYDNMKAIPNTAKNRIYYNEDIIIFEAYHPGQTTIKESVYCDSISQNVLLWNSKYRNMM